MEPHRHDENGDVILIEDTTPSDAEVEAKAITHAAEAQADAEVEIARVQADAAIALAKIERTTLDDDERVELEALRLEMAAIQAANQPPEPDPEPAPVIVNDAPAEPEPMAPPGPEHQDGEDHQRKSSHGMSSAWFG